MLKSRALTTKQFEFVISELKRQEDYRMASLVYLNSRPCRIHDVLDMRIKDIYDLDGKPRQEVFIKEQKTGKNRTLLIWTSEDSDIYKVLSEFFQSLRELSRDNYLFVSSKRKTRLTQEGVFWILNHKFHGKMGIEQISSHSIRKTTGRYLYNQGYSMEVIQEVFKHSDIRSTRTYLDINERDVRLAQEALCW